MQAEVLVIIVALAVTEVVVVVIVEVALYGAGSGGDMVVVVSALEAMNDWCFRPRFCTVKAIVGLEAFTMLIEVVVVVIVRV